jgi:hypothetical protein
MAAALAMMIGGAITNALAFSGSNYLFSHMEHCQILVLPDVLFFFFCSCMKSNLFILSLFHSVFAVSNFSIA